jgi:rubrerythrin
VESIASHNRAKLIDLLAARLAFERASGALYDTIVAILEESDDSFVGQLIPAMREYRDEERERAGWLAQLIRSLGGDPEEATAMSALVETELSGLVKVARGGDRDVSHLFHTLLTASLADTAGWQLLVTLAAEAGDEPMRAPLAGFFGREQDHLDFLRSVVLMFTRHDVLGEAPCAP